MFVENLDVFFNPEEFGSRATFTLPGGSTFEFIVIFDDAFLNPDTGLISLETTEPLASCKSSSIAALKAALAAVNGGSPILQNQTVPLRALPCILEAAPGKNFSVLQTRPEGTGTTTIVFSRERDAIESTSPDFAGVDFAPADFPTSGGTPPPLGEFSPNDFHQPDFSQP